MPRRARSQRLETHAARLKLPARLKPYHFAPIAPGGIGLGYRRNQGAGAWVLRIADGKGGYRTLGVGAADDFEDADGETILTWFQAVERGRKLATGGSADVARPATVVAALEEYERDLAARGAGTGNASRIRAHLPAALAMKPVGS
jgi:hypothetical protein